MQTKQEPISEIKYLFKKNILLLSDSNPSEQNYEISESIKGYDTFQLETKIKNFNFSSIR